MDGHKKVVKTGVPELDKMLRAVRKQGGRITRGGSGHLKVYSPAGAGPVVLNGSRAKVTVVRATRARLRKIGFSLP